MSQILSLNDWRLTVHQDGNAIYDAPAAAWEDNGSIQFGQKALESVQTHPRTTNTNYLVRLNADPLSQPFKQARNHADLLYLQLQALVLEAPTLAERPTLVLVPPATTSSQLGLLLGVAREVGLQIQGFADSASTSGATVVIGDTPHVQYLELYLHSTQLARVNTEGEEASYESIIELNDAGISVLVDGWANVIADQFVQTSRFDPLHAASTEQQLYSLVFDWFGSATPDSYVAIDHNNETRRLEISIDELTRKLSERFTGLLSNLDANIPVILGTNAAATPLLRGLLEARGLQTYAADTTPIIDLLTREAHQFGDGDVQYLRRFGKTRKLTTGTTKTNTKTTDATLPSEVPRPTALPGQPTHGLHATTAYPFGSEELPHEAIPDDAVCGSSVTVNGRLFTLIEVR